MSTRDHSPRYRVNICYTLSLNDNFGLHPQSILDSMRQISNARCRFIIFQLLALSQRNRGFELTFALRPVSLMQTRQPTDLACVIFCGHYKWQIRLSETELKC